MLNRRHIHGLLALSLLGSVCPLGGACEHECEHECPSTPMARALDAVAERSCDPAETRGRILAALGELPFCYPDDLDQQQWEVILEQYGALPICEAGRPRLRFENWPTVWIGEAEQGTSGRAQPAHLTYSFPADGVTWGSTLVSTQGANALSARLKTVFGQANLDLGREYFRQALAGWRRVSGITYDEVADDDSDMDLSLPRSGTRGDIRIGGLDLGTPVGYLAYNMYAHEGGDMVVNASYFTASQLAKPNDDYRKLRNTMCHEHGHGLGFRHSVPCDGTKLLEPEIATGFDHLAMDDIRGAIRHYGDRFAGNNSAASAHDFGDLASPAVRSVIERTLGTNGADGYNGTNADWFRFTLGNAQNVTVTVDPVGGSYSAGPQGFACGGTPAAINADQAGDLAVELYDQTGTMLIASASSGGPGVTETLALGTLGAGTYTLRVVDLGPNATADQVVQLYDLTVRVGSSPAPPSAIAGVNKRVPAYTKAWFNGSANSRASEPGATLDNSSYDWDLNGDGVFETSDQPRPVFTYTAEGDYLATLRVTDSNGLSATDTILVRVVANACPADFNGVNGVTVQDIFDFLTAWLAGSASADFNHANGVTVQDIFDFLTAWLAGC